MSAHDVCLHEFSPGSSASFHILVRGLSTVCWIALGGSVFIHVTPRCTGTFKVYLSVSDFFSPGISLGCTAHVCYRTQESPAHLEL